MRRQVPDVLATAKAQRLAPAEVGLCGIGKT